MSIIYIAARHDVTTLQCKEISSGFYLFESVCELEVKM